MREERERNMPDYLKPICSFGEKVHEERRVVSVKQKLYPEEEKMPLAKYFYKYPLHYPKKEIQEYIETCGLIDEEDVIRAKDFLELLHAKGYDKRELGYALLEDGSGYIASYRVRPPDVTEEMEHWYYKWSCKFSQNMVQNHGNLRFKISHPVDHFDKFYVNWTDGAFGIHIKENLEQKKIEYIRHSFDVLDYGFSEKRIKDLRANGAMLNGKGYFETYKELGNNFTLSISRPCPLGGTEIRTRTWIGWRPVNGEIVRDLATQCDKTYLKNCLIHSLMKWEHLYNFLPELYAEYHDLPEDAD